MVWTKHTGSYSIITTFSDNFRKKFFGRFEDEAVQLIGNSKDRWLQTLISRSKKKKKKKKKKINFPI